MARRAEPRKPPKSAPRPERIKAFQLGLSAESRAAMLLIAKAYRIIGAAEFWLASHPEDADAEIRFDVILVVPGKMPRHLTDAFDASP
jgi:Holliday junction resolvase-like predicted endonuclease